MDHWHVTYRGTPFPRVRFSDVKTWPDRLNPILGLAPCTSPVIDYDALCVTSAAQLGYRVDGGQIVRPGKAGAR